MCFFILFKTVVSISVVNIRHAHATWPDYLVWWTLTGTADSNGVGSRIFLLCSHKIEIRGYGFLSQILSQALFLHTGVYLLAWTPYATFAMVWSFGNVSEVHPVAFSVLELFAKSSCLFNPLINMRCNTAYRYELPRILMNSWYAYWVNPCSILEPLIFRYLAGR